MKKVSKNSNSVDSTLTKDGAEPPVFTHLKLKTTGIESPRVIVKHSTECEVESMGDIVDRMLTLTEAAVQLYLGEYPLDAPHCPGNQHLPWFADFHPGTDPRWRPDSDLLYIAHVLQEQAAAATEGRWHAHSTEFVGRPRALIQAAAVEALLHLRRCEQQISCEDLVGSTFSLAAGYEAFMAAVAEAQVLLRRRARHPKARRDVRDTRRG